MLKDIAKLSNGITHLITAENVYGAKGAGGRAVPGGGIQADVKKIGQNADTQDRAARDLGQKWKVRPCITLPKGGSITPILDLEMSGVITHIWMTYSDKFMRDVILRFYWDGEKSPSVECPLGDFFCMPFKKSLKILSIPINVNPMRGSNCFFPMPFRKSARITVENRNPESDVEFFYALSVDERAVDKDEAYFHAQFRRQNPTTGGDYVILDGVQGEGHYVGTSMGWQQNSEGWWGEGEVKMFIDGDEEFPSYVGTGTEDYFGGAWCFGENFSAPFFGFQDTLASEGRETNRVGNRHALYRFHVADPIRFKSDLKVTVQALGWRSETRFLPLKDDLCSVAYWYQAHPHAAFPTLGSRDDLEVI
ncbi:hypothetical protein FACS189476_06830 [Spirochaetia bacterium]|nr:hypothetical protein FACS189476_06830 [Spirochaetia bacterium]